ncbi:MAG TPA: tetratricopeptide repeat protein [Allosphingosinicella sp.]|nr:tetratricopeptide repeat protein [Allosphingosinicella sp.]
MSSPLEAYRIFIASPSGLKAVRERFRATIDKYNETDANRRGVMFMAVGWEATLPGIGRPQKIINDDLHGCDYFVLVLHDRWGTPASNEPDAETGSEEEFRIALELQQDSDKAMRDVVVFFVSVDPGKMSDPGPQLQKVLDFRKKIEADKKLLYRQVENADDFADALRAHLARWLHNHEQGKAGGNGAEAEVPAESETIALAPEPAEVGAPGPDDQGTASPAAPNSGDDLVARANQLIAESKPTEAESLLATAAEKRNNPAHLLAYAELLARLSRPRAAVTEYEATADLAQDAGEAEIALRALLALAYLQDDLGRGDKAEEAAARAIEISLATDELPGAARARILLGERRRRAARFAEAEEEYRQSIDLAAHGGDPLAEADARIGLSEVFRDQERLDEARESLCKGIALKQQGGVTDLGDAYAALGAILETMGDEDGAEKHYGMSLELFKQKGDRSGRADAADHLGQVRLRRGDLEGAEDAFRDSASLFEGMFNFEGAADAYLSLGRIQTERGDLGAAEESFRSALSLAERKKDPAARSLREDILNYLESIIARAGAVVDQPPPAG